MAEWHTSSFSGDANCVEVAWRKSSFSGQEINCVEVAFREPIANIRDSKQPEAGHLTLPAPAYRTFLATLTGR
ncbi:DUF397 domain-containing protein [Actinokineospora xionganensis]|uniref:DUF397 domain-containing protein n=1 Tax=Actinokineospora xionganensis TaxID=2684470 RepID=A0ABR7L9H3_9PSEU|nr:DUF397 domain-containing protein [Actinokineospora xionganensis]MBC6449339.1 DUF397 domain-containing protein [Actinokineospora xionganensis]